MVHLDYPAYELYLDGVRSRPGRRGKLTIERAPHLQMVIDGDRKVKEFGDVNKGPTAGQVLRGM